MKNPPPNPLVVALAYDGLCTFEFGVAVEIFGLARPELGPDWYRFAVAAVDEGELRATGGVRVMADGDMSLIAQAGTVIVPGWRGADTPVPDALCQQLREAHRRGCRILSICSGVFVLAAAGLLEGCRATTHWRYLETLQQRYPDVEVVPDVLYVDEGTVLTSAGSAAGIDLCLHLVRRDFGQEATNSVARRLVVQPHRDGGQTQNIVRPVPVARESKRLGLLFDYLHQQLADNHTVASLASRAGMSPRTFLRRFQDATGTTPARWLLNERLMRARGMLEKTRLSLDSIAIQVGFGSSSTLRYHFQQHFSVSPAAYRKSFT
ncbi:transcriptional regulator FtrA [Atlantibacter hermannii]|uniref:Putative AraC family transcriptional regulator n=1 Tax=Atlantibacter hermannii NBRC 105704 TaxID=1115512 RepID=H5V2B3_ATLHE|nr:transcriptional regulator FtrA [Atlantibacter hermannii]MDQ7881573.1 transcriptional regulator FtrA [Atlantibacter hermannii]MDU7388487.1 transcriptional regulator FtrA [Atlantibacter hermannii]MDU7812846.1 transcriptional regulator FtrA [Atlantibacter hermannii]QPS93693.1 transcriptional regulator FtrA [Atlantibacter hermannii]WIF59991.1 transcriptional regulator FtrA [Atlantibacter hermannii]